MQIAKVLLTVFLCALLGPVASAAPNGDVRVSVHDAQRIGIDSATARLKAIDRPGLREAKCDTNGEAVFTSVPAGSYEVTATKPGFNVATLRFEVRQDETVDVALALQIGSLTETVVVTRPAPIVETTTSSLSSHITLEEVERIPVGRDYVAYAQLVPGVSVVVNGGGVRTPVDPSSKGGNNYIDRGGNPGSRDNVYLLDGFNITDIGGGFASLEFNNEVILEDHVTTSGIPASYSGARGFLGNVVTKSGSNAWEASASFYAHDAGWYSGWKSDNDLLRTVHDDQSDYALTLGGPVVHDRMTFFASVQRRESHGDITLSSSASPTPASSTYRFERMNAFAKVSLTPTYRDALTAMYYGDDRVTTGTTDPNLPLNRYGRGDDTQAMFATEYQRVLGSSLLAQLRGSLLDRDTSGSPDHPDLGPSNTLVFPAGTIVPAYERDLGASGGTSTSKQKRIQIEPTVTWNFDARGSHVLRGGIQQYGWFERSRSALVDGVALTSLPRTLAGRTFAQAISSGILPQGEFDYILRALQAQPSSASFATVDANHDGTVTAEELAAISFSSTTGNAAGINFLRARDLQVGTNKVESKNVGGYVQDDWTIGNLNLQLGLRFDDWKYTASDGSTIVDMDATASPRLGISWDPRGDGRQRLSFFYGRYYDPLLTPVVRFAGNLSGTVQAEEIFLGNTWFDYRLRGSATRRDAVFAPNLKNQRQDEYALTWGLNLSRNTGVTAQAYFRRDGNLIEDYDPVYFDRNAAGDLTLTPGQFGFPASGPAGANYFVGNLVGGKRETRGIDLSVDRRFAGSWSGSLQYSWKDAKGNSNSDANTDLQGDFLTLDPRLSYMWGPLPGSVDHQVKMFGAYRTPVKLEIGGLLYWSSGAHYTEADIFRPASYNIIMNHHRADGSYAQSGGKTQPSYMVANARLRYPLGFAHRFEADFVLDVYNVLDNQDAFLVEEGYNHPQYAYGATRVVLEPRRWEMGIRLRM